MTSKYKPSDFIIYVPTGKKSIYITRSGAFIKFEYFNGETEQIVKYIKKISNYFKLSSRNVLGDIQYLKCYTMNKKNGRMIVPRFGIFEILESKYGLVNFKCVSQIPKGEPPDVPFVWCAKQTDNQKIITDTILNHYYTQERVSAGSAGVIVDLDAGQGKSFVAAYLIAKLQRKTVIVLHTTALIEQWTKVIKIALGDVSIGYYYAKKKCIGDIMIMIVNSAAKDEFIIDGETIPAIEFYAMFGLFIYDECHLYSNKKSLKALKIAQGTYMLGLSATTAEHVLNYDRAVWWNIGPVLDTRKISNFISTSENFKAIVHRVMYSGPEKYTKLLVNEHTGLVSISQTINMICDDKLRSKLVIDCIQNGLKLGLMMFVFADRREYLSELCKMLSAGEIVTNDDEFVRIVGGSKNELLENAEIKSRVIFTTYQYMGTGKSIVKMNGLVLATPRKSKMKQYINRIFRLGSDESIVRHIWDICDTKLSCGNQWFTRKKHYDEKKYTIEQTNVHFTDISNGISDEIEEPPYLDDKIDDKIDDTINNTIDDKNKLDKIINIMHQNTIKNLVNRLS
jgi:hypothetical protein